MKALPQARSSNRKEAFTLIELLVIAAIIAVVISLLLPALSQAREKSKAVVCMSNLKELAFVFFKFGEEHNDAIASLALGLYTCQWLAGGWGGLYRFNRVPDPVNKVLLVDGNWFDINVRYYLFYGNASLYQNNVANVHSNGTSVLAVDGSVRWKIWSSLVDP